MLRPNEILMRLYYFLAYLVVYRVRLLTALFLQVKIHEVFLTLASCLAGALVNFFHFSGRRTIIEGFHYASSDRKSPYWRHSASQQSTGTEVYPERRQGKWLIIAVFQVVPIGQIEKNIWNIIDFQKLLKTRERNARDYQRKGGAWLHSIAMISYS